MRSARPRGTGRRLLMVLPLTIALGATLTAHAPVAAGEASCVVTNLATPSGTIGGLQVAVDLAAAGDTLQVIGTCHFGTVIWIGAELGGSAVAKFLGCGTTTYVGVKARVVGNTPKNIKTYISAC